MPDLRRSGTWLSPLPWLSRRGRWSAVGLMAERKAVTSQMAVRYRRASEAQEGASFSGETVTARNQYERGEPIQTFWMRQRTITVRTY